MNTCPVYRRGGGHSYGATVPGPIGSILEPGRDLRAHRSLPYASSLCGSCSDICPVKIDLHHQLLARRREIASRGWIAPGRRLALKLAARALRHPRAYRLGGAALRACLRWLPRRLLEAGWNPWARQRVLPTAPRESFRQLYARRSRDGQG
jgi:L-lactate dehydrogenase complex protein LldF